MFSLLALSSSLGKHTAYATSVLTNIWEGFRKYLNGMAPPGQAGEFLLAHLAQLAGLTVLIVLILRALRPLRDMERSEYERWRRSQALALGHRAFLSAGHCLAEHSALIAFALWFWLALWVLGLSAAPVGRIIFFLLVALCAFRAGSALVGDLFAGEKAGGILPLDDATARFYRRRLRLFLAYVLCAVPALESAHQFGPPAWDHLFLRQIFGVGIFFCALLLLSPRHLSVLLEKLHFPPRLSSLKVVKVIRGLVLLVPLIVILMDLLGFHETAANLGRSVALSIMLAIFAALVWLVTAKLLESLLKPWTGWAFGHYPNQGPLLETVYRASRTALAVLLGTAAFFGTLLLWGIEANKLLLAFQLLDRGPNVGPLKLTPLNIASGALFIYLGIWFSGKARGLMGTSEYLRTRWDEGMRYSLSTVVHYSILIAAGLTALSALGFPLGNLALVAGALGVGVGFGLQNLVKDFISGLVLLFERPIKVGDMLVVDKQWGRVKAIRLRSTIFETFDGYVLCIPNSELLSGKILNWTYYGWGVNQLTLKVGIACDSDVRKAAQVITEACRANPMVLDDPPPQVQFDAFADYSLSLTIQVYLATPAQRGSATHELNSAILGALREHGIAVPVPQRDVYVKSWPEIKGDE